MPAALAALIECVSSNQRACVSECKANNIHSIMSDQRLIRVPLISTTVIHFKLLADVLIECIQQHKELFGLWPPDDIDYESNIQQVALANIPCFLCRSKRAY